MNVGEINQRRYQVRVELERSSIRGGRLLTRGLIAIVKRRSSTEVFFGQSGVARRCARGWYLSRRFFRPLQRENLRRRGIEPEVECELAPVRGQQRADRALERAAFRELVVRLLDDGH